MRSWLFVPGDSDRKLDRALDSGADALVLDLEDSIAPSRKAEARTAVRMFLAGGPRREGQRYFVRINPLASGLALADLAAVVPGRPDGIMLPKCDPDQVRTADHYLSALEAASGMDDRAICIVAIGTEVPGAVFHLGGYKAITARLAALTWGAEDLAAVLGAANRGADGRFEDVFRLARALCLLGAGAAEVEAIDTVFTDYRNGAGLRAECIDARRAGFSGKMAIHPDQVPVINEAFTPNPDEVAWARRVVEAFDAQPDAGVVGIEGRMIDRPHLTLARRLLARL
ncbi:MAG: CoA ester lyase [Gammaproteobacteria bacterium]